MKTAFSHVDRLLTMTESAVGHQPHALTPCFLPLRSATNASALQKAVASASALQKAVANASALQTAAASVNALQTAAANAKAHSKQSRPTRELVWKTDVIAIALHLDVRRAVSRQDPAVN